MDSLCFTIIIGAICSFLVVWLMGDGDKEDRE